MKFSIPDLSDKPEMIVNGKVSRGVGSPPLLVVPVAAMHIIALVQFVSAFPHSDMSTTWLPQGIFLIVLSAVFALSLFSGVVKGLALRPTLGFHCLVYLLTVYPTGATMGFEVTLLSSLVYEIVLLSGLPLSAIISSIMVGLTLILSLVGTAWNRTIPSPSLSLALNTVLFPMVVLVFSVALKHLWGFALNQRRLIKQLNDASLMLMETNVSLQDHILIHDAHVQELERNRISRELHDTVGYTLMNIIALQKAAFQLSRMDEDEARSFITQTITQAEQGLKETRNALRVLRERVSDVPILPDAVNRLVRAFEHTHISIVPNYGNLRKSYGADIDQVIYKFIQEAITNAIKHGNATRIEISFWTHERSLEAVVEDDGDGIILGERLQEGLGMKGMRERVEELGGEILTGNVAGGFKIKASLPLGVQIRG